MPIYEYLCTPCNAIDEFQLKQADSDKPRKCQDCGALMNKKMSRPNVVTRGCEVAYMHPAFGTMMTDTQAKAEAKRRGWDEVGTEDMDKVPAAPKPKSYDENDYFV